MKRAWWMSGAAMKDVLTVAWFLVFLVVASVLESIRHSVNADESWEGL